MSIPGAAVLTGSKLSRRALLGLLSAAGAGLATGCAGPGSIGNRRAPSGASTGAIEGTVSFAHWRAEDQKAFDGLIAAFVQQYPQAKVTQDISPANDYLSQALNRLHSGRVGDIFATFRGAQFSQFVKAGVYVDLTGNAVVDAYDPQRITAGAVDGKQWGLPYQIIFPMPIVNVAAWEGAGVSEPPASWDAYLDALDKIKSDGLIPLAWPGGDLGNGGNLLSTMVVNNAPSDDIFVQVEQGRAKVTDDWFVHTLRQCAQLRPYVQPNAVGTAAEPAQQLFVSGKAASLVTGSYMLGAVRALGADFDLDLIPPITTEAGQAKYEGVHNAGLILGVNAGSKVQPAAFAFLDFLSDRASATTYANATVQHVTVAGVEYTNADLKQLMPWLSRKTALTPRFQFLDVDIRSAVEESCIKVIGGTKPDEAAEAAQAIIDQRI
jgi:raffinose/stachyose/melibiose transport system substrate-binding protein